MKNIVQYKPVDARTDLSKVELGKLLCDRQTPASVLCPMSGTV